jgi:hypothetical protein
MYSTILCAVSRKKQVTTASHAAGRTDKIVRMPRQNLSVTQVHILQSETVNREMQEY